MIQDDDRPVSTRLSPILAFLAWHRLTRSRSTSFAAFGDYAAEVVDSMTARGQWCYGVSRHRRDLLGPQKGWFVFGDERSVDLVNGAVDVSILTSRSQALAEKAAHVAKVMVVAMYSIDVAGLEELSESEHGNFWSLGARAYKVRPSDG